MLLTGKIKQNFIIIILVLIVASVSYSAWFVFQILRPASSSGEIIPFSIEKGEGVNAISRDLKKAGLINSKWDFEVYAWLMRIEGKFQAGEYNIGKNANIIGLSEILISGQAVPNERMIIIIEGWNIKEIADYLDKEGIVSQEDFLAAADRSEFWAEKYPFLKEVLPVSGLEGYLFPDTYRIYKDSAAEGIIAKMLDNFSQKFTPELRQEAEKRGKSVFEIIKMASIIEKEVRTDEDRKLVADVFYRRLEAGMPLESCASIAYILGVNKRQYTIEDTRTESPYNTYLNRGLPPGPICNPGLSAIQAAVYPAANNYWYFLSKDAKDGGETVFSRSFEEHVVNKNKWLR